MPRLRAARPIARHPSTEEAAMSSPTRARAAIALAIAGVAALLLSGCNPVDSVRQGVEDAIESASGCGRAPSGPQRVSVETTASERLASIEASIPSAVGQSGHLGRRMVESDGNSDGKLLARAMTIRPSERSDANRH